jgi:hypothetical protein
MWSFLSTLLSLLANLVTYLQRKQLVEQGRQEVRAQNDHDTIVAAARVQEIHREADRAALPDLAGRMRKYQRD